MKLLLFLLQLLSVITGICQVADYVKQPVKSDIRNYRFGPEAGAGITTFISSEQSTRNYLPDVGYNLGFFYEYIFDEYFSLRFGFNYDKTSTRQTNEIYTQPGNTYLGVLTTHEQLYYLQLPLIGKLTLGEQTIFFIGAGVTGVMLLTAERTNNAVGTLIPANAITITNRFKTFNVLLTGSIGVSFPLKKEHLRLTIETRHQIGMNNINNNLFSINETIQTYSGLILTGIAIRLPSKKNNRIDN